MAGTFATATGRTAIAAHRAGAALWPENSFTAFRHALTLPVEFIEFDVHQTADGVLVVHHDAVLGRTIDGAGEIARQSWEELRPLPVIGAPGERMPMLAEILPLFDGSKIRPRLELKTQSNGQFYAGMTKAVVSMLASCGLKQRVVITSFDETCLEQAQDCGVADLIYLMRPELSQTLAEDPAAYCAKWLSKGVNELSIRGVDATAQLVTACRDAGMTLGAYAGKDMDFQRLLTIGLSVFTSDRPDLALAARDRLA